jgi:hypothetical protein
MSGLFQHCVTIYHESGNIFHFLNACYISCACCDQALNPLILDPGFDFYAVTNINTDREIKYE